MILKRLYSEPPGLFRSGKAENPFEIHFKLGFNFIFGHKDSQADSKESLNGLGKSTVGDLIDFCLLADFSSRNKRLFKEEPRLAPYKIALEFELGAHHYCIKRSVSDNLRVEFGEIGDLENISTNEAKDRLFSLVFSNPDYEGILDPSWFRALMSFFLKIHKKAKGDFLDPIRYRSPNDKTTEVNQYHFLLLGLDNRLLYQNYLLQKKVGDRNAAIRKVRQLVDQAYGLSINDVKTELSKLGNEIAKSKAAVDAFKLAEQYKDVEAELNDLTGKIKHLAEKNFWSNKRLTGYRESMKIKDNLSPNKISSIERSYSEIHSELGDLVKRTLEEAVAFRKQIAQSREEFLSQEIWQLERQIVDNEREIDKYDIRRRQLFLLLQSKEAFTDLTEAFYYLREREREYADLESRIKVYQELDGEKLAYEKEDVEIKLEMKQTVEEMREKIRSFETIFLDVFNNIYPESRRSGFSITASDNAEKVKIDISFDKDESKGWNRARTLVYDIAVVLNGIRNNLKLPRFLLHDGIFDGMDKAQFVELYHYIQDLNANGNSFQYIVTMIEEGVLLDNFGDTGDLTVENIVKEAIAVYTPSKKLWVV